MRHTAGPDTLPEPVWIAFGYTAFMIASLEFIGLESLWADMTLSAIVYLAAGLMLQLRSHPAWKAYLLLGVILGFAYLDKAVLLPLSTTFILGSLTLRDGMRKLLLHAMLAAAGLALVAGPRIAALSKHLGRFTFSESGTETYIWHVNQISFWWSGDPPGSGTPLHPRRKLFDKPAAFTYDQACPCTYPGQYDPTYWMAGVKTRFNPRLQFQRLKISAQELSELFLGKFQVPLIAALLIYLLGGLGRPSLWSRIREYWFLFLPPMAAVALYAPVLVEPRYIGPFLPLFWAGAFACVRIGDEPASRRPVPVVATAAVAITAILLAASTLVAMDAAAPPAQFEVARYLQDIGIRPGDPVGSIGTVTRWGWARLARVHVSTEINHPAQLDFRAAPDEIKSQAMAALFGTGIKAVVADHPEKSGCPFNWQAVGRTGFSVCAATAPGVARANE